MEPFRQKGSSMASWRTFICKSVYTKCMVPSKAHFNLFSGTAHVTNDFNTKCSENIAYSGWIRCLRFHPVTAAVEKTAAVSLRSALGG